jgi:hypothetical protein
MITKKKSHHKLGLKCEIKNQQNFYKRLKEKKIKK